MEPSVDNSRSIADFYHFYQRNAAPFSPGDIFSTGFYGLWTLGCGGV